MSENQKAANPQAQADDTPEQIQVRLEKRKKLLEKGVDVLRNPSGRAAGSAMDAQGRLVFTQFDGSLTRLDKDGKPWAPNKKYEYWNGKAWTGPDVPDMRPNAAPEENVGSFIMNPEGVARLHAIGMAEGPFPEHYEPFETPVGRAIHRLWLVDEAEGDAQQHNTSRSGIR